MSDRSFRDPVHGFIRLTDAECELLETAPFRRLRLIRQLALTNLVYHGAEHTRFGHTLGVMHQGSRFLDAVRDKASGLGWSQDEFDKGRQLLRLGALCHDVGHSPFSHAGEEGNLLQGEHEEYSVAIVRATSGKAGEIRQVMEARKEELAGVTADQVAELIEKQTVGKEAFLNDLLSGELDCDRTDYLQRDSIYCGVQYGRFDSERLVSTLTLTPDRAGGNPVLALEEDGIHAAEGLILARYFMFTQVYFHRVRRAFDFHLGAALRAKIGTYPSPSEIDEYLSWNDLRVLGTLNDMISSGEAGSDHARRVLERDHYRVAFETNDHPSDPQIRRWDSELVPAVKEKFGDSVAFDNAEKAPHRFDRQIREFPVIKHHTAPPSSVEEESGLIDKLEVIRLRRVFAPKELQDEVGAFCQSLNLNTGGTRPAL